MFKQWQEFKAEFGDITNLPTRQFVTPMTPGTEFAVDIEPGKTLFIKMKAIGEADASGMRDIQFIMNGEPRTVRVKDKKANQPAKGSGGGGGSGRPKADKVCCCFGCMPRFCAVH